MKPTQDMLILLQHPLFYIAPPKLIPQETAAKDVSYVKS